MGLFKWVERKMKKMRWYDVSFVKLSSAAFALMIAKLWSPILALDWYWYLVIAVVAAIVPWCDMFRKK